MISKDHFGRKSYKVVPTRKFSSAADYDKALAKYCKDHGYITSGPGDDTPSALALQQARYQILKELLHTDRAVRDDIIGLDAADMERIEVLWCEEFEDARITTFCGMNVRPGSAPHDYTEKAKLFAKDFFGSTSWTYMPDESIDM